jgi:hypothetical protein
MSKIEVDAIDKQSGSTLTLGGSGTAVTLACGATQSGFGRTGTVDWQTSSIKTATFTAADGEGYFANTSGGAFTMNLPAGSAGAIVSVSDYTRTFQTNNLTVSPNGSEKIGGVVGDAILSTEGQTATFVYVDGTEGWINTQETSNSVTGATFMCASVSGTGNTLATAPDCANVKIATFTGPGTFTVNSISSCAANNEVSYLVVAGGGGGAAGQSAGGGAGGFRETKSPITPYTASPKCGYSTPGNRLTLGVAGYSVVIGGGGSGRCFPSTNNGVNGSNSSFSGITSVGGGGGGQFNGGGASGGSGGGGGGNGPGNAGGTGNSPSVTPSQGSPGGDGNQPDGGGGGGGGATADGADSVSPREGGAGGAGATTSISASPTAYSGGGGGGAGTGAGGAGGTGGGGKGGSGNQPSVSPAVAGTANTGGGGGGGGNSPAAQGNGKNGGSGIVIIRYKFQ